MSTITSPIISAPRIEGTPSGSGLPTVTLKKGSGTGTNYTTTSTSYVDVDTTNLAYSVVIPVGWKLTITVRATLENSAAISTVGVALADGATVINEARTRCESTSGRYPIALLWAITGAGATHNIRLQFRVFAAVTGTIHNVSASELPTMLFVLMPSN